jgi:hypothetical protein
MELESLSAWVVANHPTSNSDILLNAVHFHIEAARQAARGEGLNPRKRLHLPRSGSLRERAMSNLDAAEAQLLNIAHRSTCSVRCQACCNTCAVTFGVDPI